MRSIALCVLMVIGCVDEGGVVRITVDAAERLSGVSSFRVIVNNHGIDSAPVDVPIKDGPVELPPARTLSLSFSPDRNGPATVDVQARDADGNVLASASGSVEIVSGKVSDVSVMLGGRPVDVPDMTNGTPIDAGAGDMVAERDAAADMAHVADLATPPDLSPDCSVVRRSCTEHLAAGCLSSGPYVIAPNGLPATDVYCDMTSDGGGWALVYSNSNNWADNMASDVSSTKVGNYTVFRWYDSKWKLIRSRDPKWLGRPWRGGALDPLSIGSANVKDLYESGMDSVRFEFIEGTTGIAQSAWCRAQQWDWRAENGSRFECRGQDANGKTRNLCLSALDPCDRTPANSGWANNIALGDAMWDYANQSAPNHLGPDQDHGGSNVGMMVIGWAQRTHANNAVGRDYQVRIWLR